jgi:mono/diheme cytochrome c family protein
MLKRCFIFTLALAASASAGAAQTRKLPLDNRAADDGLALFTIKGCSGCHTIGGGRLAGPDLVGATERRDTLWLHKLLEDPPALAEKDTAMQRMIEEANGVIMPNLGLTAAERRALIHYLARETERLRVKK